MKKALIIILSLAACAFLLSACTPKADEVEKKFKENGYEATTLEASEVEDYGIEADSVEYMMVFSKDSQKVFVVAFKDGADATNLYNDQYTLRDDKTEVIKKRNVVVFGDPDSVEIF